MKTTKSAKGRAKERKFWRKMDAAVSQICDGRDGQELLNEYNDCVAGHAKIYNKSTLPA